MTKAAPLEEVVSEVVAAPVEPDADERREFPRYSFHSQAKFMLEDQSEHEAELIDISVGGMAVQSETVPAEGEYVVFYVDQLGRVEGHVSRHFEGGFSVQFSSSQRQRQRMIERLKWLHNGQATPREEMRQHERRPVSQKSQLRDAEGREWPCRIVDISQSGLGLETTAPLVVGEVVEIGETKGRVVRRFGKSVGIEFLGRGDAS